jgi:hypothetical protein
MRIAIPHLYPILPVHLYLIQKYICTWFWLQRDDYHEFGLSPAKSNNNKLNLMCIQFGEERHMWQKIGSGNGAIHPVVEAPTADAQGGGASPAPTNPFKRFRY